MNKFTVLQLLIGSSLLAACAGEERKTFDGYVEGEYIYLSVPQGGYLTNISVTRGERVEPGKTVFALEAEPESYGLKEAEARENSAKARLENLIEPRRAQEIASLESQLSAADTALVLSERQLTRRKELAKKQYLSQDQLNEAQAIRDRDAAQVDSLKHQLETYKLSVGRKSEVNSAQAELEAAHAVVEQKQWSKDKKSISAPAEGEIFDTYYKVGEWVPPGQPVASLLPDNGRKLRFFVPETKLSQLTLGQKIQANCDGCSEKISATIDFISPQAEYTPPIIYTQNKRDKLVFRVEALISPDQMKSVHPGLPVDISLNGG